VTLFGAAATPYEMEIRVARTDVSWSTAIFHGFISPNTARQYGVNFNPAPGGILGVVKMVSFDTLRQDLQTTFQLGQIGEAPFVGQLDQFLANGQKALAKKDGGNKTEAVEQLRQFIDKINKAAKGPSPEDEGKRFVNAPALNALSSDAKTLIVQLGGSLQDH
jgi:hypothetical protein